MIRTPTPEADEKNSFRLLHLLPLISKVRHLARSISWQAIDTLSALASTARISQTRERCRPRKVLLWRPAHKVRQHTGSRPLSPRVLRRVTLQIFLSYVNAGCYHSAAGANRVPRVERSRAELSVAAAGRPCEPSDKPNVLSCPPAQSTRLTCSVIDAVI